MWSRENSQIERTRFKFIHSTKIQVRGLANGNTSVTSNMMLGAYLQKCMKKSHCMHFSKSTNYFRKIHNQTNTMAGRPFALNE